MKNNSYNFLSLLEEQDAFVHGHFELSCARHSAVYIKALELFSHAHIAKKIATCMSEKFVSQVDIVLSPSEETFVIAKEVAAARGARAAYALQNALGANFIIKPEESVLVVDDVAVSGRQIARACALVKSLGARLVGVSVIVDRSLGELPLSAPLRALLSYPLVTYEPGECPLCKQHIALEKK